MNQPGDPIPCGTADNPKSFDPEGMRVIREALTAAELRTMERIAELSKKHGCVTYDSEAELIFDVPSTQPDTPIIAEDRT